MSVGIHITKNIDGKQPEITDIMTEGYILLYMSGNEMKSTGSIEMKALAPLLFKLAAEKLAR
jgi:hypothetical protein